MKDKNQTEKVYLRPAGFFSVHAKPPKDIGSINGGWAGFTCLELMRRENGDLKRSWNDVGDIVQNGDASARNLLDIIQKPCAVPDGMPALNQRPHIMGIVNVTPDSFSDGGSYLHVDAAVSHGLALIGQGADILDIGGESTRPGAKPVSIEQEIERVVPVIGQLKEPARKAGVPISVDTRNSAVMTAALKAGAGIINDVTALTHAPGAMEIVAEAGVPVCLMHSQGTPETMQDNPQYGDVVVDIYDYLADRIEACEKAGIAPKNIWIDPGIGFGKLVEHNTALIEQISIFHGLGVPILLGASRKSFIGAIAGESGADKRLPGSLVVMSHAINAGVQVIRVHDVAESVQAMKVCLAITGAV